MLEVGKHNGENDEGGETARRGETIRLAFTGDPKDRIPE